MKETKSIKLKLAVLSIVIMLSFSACSKATDEDEGLIQKIIYDIGNFFSKKAGENSLTSESNLKGKRQFGIDKYLGNYKAEYKGFTGSETLFGGSTIDRNDGNILRVRCQIITKKGSAKITWNSGDKDEIILLDKEGTYAKTIQIKGGWESLKFEGKNFTGDVEIVVE